jgi:opacity protein-like surface antigen
MGGSRIWWGLVFLLAAAFASDAAAAGSRADSAVPYTEDRWSLQVMTGPLVSSSTLGPDIPDFDCWQTNIRIGWMLSSPDGDGGVLDGNLELLAELTGSLVYEGFGDYVAGIAGIVRYNVTGLHPRLVPYVQGGVGLVYTDAHQDPTQKAIGQGFNFAPRAGLGFRYLLSESWSLDAEGVYEHISNAGMDDRNAGVNAFGGFVGVTYFWDGP